MAVNFSRFSSLALFRDCLFSGICATLGFAFSTVVVAAPGQLDQLYGTKGTIDYSVGTGASRGNAFAVSPQGALYSLSACFSGSARQHCIEKWLSPGERDVTYGTGGVVMVSTQARIIDQAELHATPDGLIIVAGCLSTGSVPYPCIVRLGYDGVQWTVFQDGGVPGQHPALENVNIGQGSLVSSSGDVYVPVWCATPPCLLKWHSDGQFVAGFQVSSIAEFYVTGAIAELVNGQLMVTGWCRAAPPATYSVELCASKVNPISGTVDANYGASGIRRFGAYSNSSSSTRAALRADGSLYVASSGFANNVYVVKLGSGGEPVGSFGTSSVALNYTPTTNVSVRDVLIDPQGRPIVFATCNAISPPSTIWIKWCVLRWTEDGISDYQFGANGSAQAFFPHPIAPNMDSDVQTAGGLIIDGDNRLVLLGGCTRGFGSSAEKVCLARLKGGPYNPLSCALNADANQTIDSTTDALLLTRYLLGLRGDALTNGALGQNPTRTGQALETYLASLDLDVDGDGQLLATTDGLLLIRAMLGLTGDALTQGATNAAHPNVRNAQQILSWIESTHGVACLP